MPLFEEFPVRLIRKAQGGPGPMWIYAYELWQRIAYNFYGDFFSSVLLPMEDSMYRRRPQIHHCAHWHTMVFGLKCGLSLQELPPDSQLISKNLPEETEINISLRWGYGRDY